MKPADALSKDARALLRAARGGDDITATARQRVLQAFQETVAVDGAAASTTRLHAASRNQPRLLPRPGRRFTWLLAAVVSTGSLMALAHEGAFEGWGAAIEEVLGTLTRNSSPGSAQPAVKGPTVRRDPTGDAPTNVAELAAPEAPMRAAEVPMPSAEEPLRADEPVRAAEEPLSAATRPKRGSNAEPATKPAGVGLPSADAAGTMQPGRAVRSQASIAGSNEVTPGPSAPGAQSSAPTSSASDELDLIVMARNALARRRHADARNAAELHALQFPRGQFSEEREAILALADCRETGSSERARVFIARRRDALLAERVRRDCKLASNLVPATPALGTHEDGSPKSRER